MAAMASNLRADDATLLVVDLQPTFLSAIDEADRVLDRSEFILRIAGLLDIPAFATEQYPSRMGGTHERIRPFLTASDAFGKMVFSCCGCSDLMDRLKTAGRRQVVLIGIETHICVSQTAHDLREAGYGVVVCADAVSARTPNRHQLGLERIRAAGVTVAHSESVAYEWLRSAEHPRFREALQVVKAHG